MSAAATAAAGPALLQMRAVTKRFPGVTALDAVDFDARAGEVHALMGENGAGKSTLMKILNGVYRQDEGEVVLDGVPAQLSGPRSAQALGLAIIHQELNQVAELSACENFFLGRELRGPLGCLDRRRMRAETLRWLAELGLQLDPGRRLGDLRVAERQLLEIAKAISLRARVLVMDEPTTALSTEEVGQLFRVVRRLRAAGMAIIYISHRMDEIFAIADRITVLRDGRRVDSRPAPQFSRDSLIALMVGRELTQLYPQRAGRPGAEVLRLSGLCVRGGPGRQALRDVSLTVRGGEIVGLAGLLGAGRSEVLEAIYGVAERRREGGELRLDGALRRLRSPRAAIAAGIGFVSEDRKGRSLVLVRSVRENTSLAALGRFGRAGLLHLGRELAQVAAAVRAMRVKTPSLDTAVAALSGGNQQKVVLARLLLSEPRVVLLDEPTQGIDVGAKAEIYAWIERQAQQGAALLLASSEMPELLALCDRIVVLCDGRVAGELARADATQEKILELATRFAPLHHNGPPSARAESTTCTP